MGNAERSWPRATNFAIIYIPQTILSFLVPLTIFVFSSARQSNMRPRRSAHLTTEWHSSDHFINTYTDHCICLKTLIVMLNGFLLGFFWASNKNKLFECVKDAEGFSMVLSVTLLCEAIIPTDSENMALGLGYYWLCVMSRFNVRLCILHESLLCLFLYMQPPSYRYKTSIAYFLKLG